MSQSLWPRDKGQGQGRAVRISVTQCPLNSAKSYSLSFLDLIGHLRSKSRLWIILTLIGNLSKNYGAIFYCVFAWNFPLAHDLKRWFLLLDVRWYISPVYYESLFKIDIQTIGHKTSVVKSYRLPRSLNQGLLFRRILPVDGPEFRLWVFRIFEENILLRINVII